MSPQAPPSKVLRVLLAALTLVLVIGAAFGIWRTWRGPLASVERDEVVLVCTGCGTEQHMKTAALNKLEPDDETGGYECTSCKKFTAFNAPFRCHNCGRWVPLTPDYQAKAYVCPFCKKSLEGAVKIKTPGK